MRHITLLIIVLILALVGFSRQIWPRIAPFTCANSISCVKDLSGKPQDDKFGVFMGNKINIPENIVKGVEERQVLGQSTAQNKHIYVDLSKQLLTAYEGDKLVYQFPVSTGKWYPTPTGDFKIWIKLRYTRMSGGNAAIGTYYDLPNVPYVMFFYNNEYSQAQGFSLHGTYWHNNFGHPMSHGCVNMRTEDVEKVFNWTNPPLTGSSTWATNDTPGTLITIYGVTPND